MLRQRLITALLLLPLAVAAVLLLPNLYLAVLLAALLVVASLEWLRLCGYAGWQAQAGMLLMIGAGMWLGWRVAASAQALPVLGLIVGCWFAAGALLVARRQTLAAVPGKRPGLLLLGAVLLATAWVAMVKVHARGADGPPLLLFLLALIWVADSVAYFSGRALGRHRLAPIVSPGKTWEGLFGALLGALLCALILARLNLLPGIGLPGLIALCMGTVLASIAGDLFESLLKRQHGVKDSGDLLPGHGGLLDRIDSLIAAAPVYLFGILLGERLA